ANRGQGSGHVEAPGEARALGLTLGDGGAACMAPQAWVEGRAIGIAGARARGPCDLGAGGTARVEQSHGFEPLRGRRVGGHALGLPQYRLRPAEPEPAQVGKNGGDELGLGTPGIDVFDAQQEAAAERPGAPEAKQGGERVTEVQLAVGTGRKPEDRRWMHVGGACVKPRGTATPKMPRLERG